MTDRGQQNARAKPGACVNLAGGLDSTNQNEYSGTEFSTDAKILASKSTAIEIQLAKVVALLRQGPKTTVQLRSRGIMMPAARVFQLKKQHGLNISTELVTLYDHEGVRHRNCARYHLLEGEPEKGA